MTWKLADEWRPSKLQHYWEQPEYWEESWGLEETCCHSNSSERPPANAVVKNSKGVNNNNDNWFIIYLAAFYMELEKRQMVINSSLKSLNKTYLKRTFVYVTSAPLWKIFICIWYHSKKSVKIKLGVNSQLSSLMESNK